MEIGKCDYKGFNVFDVPTGNHQLQVQVQELSSLGTCTITTNFSLGSERYFEIKPRSADYALFLLGGVAGMVISAMGTCGGAFSIEEESPRLALEKIKILNLTQ